VSSGSGSTAYVSPMPAAEGQDGLVDPVDGELPQHPLDHGHPDDGEHLLGRRKRQGTESCSLAPDKDNRFHYLVVVVDEGFVVVVAGTLDVVLDAAGAVVVVAGTIDVVAPATVVLVEDVGA
jgi:hypothetical protein